MKSLTQALKVHVALNVRDVEASVAFYRRLFGIDPAKAHPGYAKFDVEFPPVNLSLNQCISTESGRLSHLGIQVPSTDAVLSIRQQWRDSGLAPRDEMQTNCCYALQDKAWVQDPDGNEWEVFVVLQDDVAETKPCCSSEGSTLVTIEQQSSERITTCKEDSNSSIFLSLYV